MLQTLRDKQLYANLMKCKLWLDKVSFLEACGDQGWHLS